MRSVVVFDAADLPAESGFWAGMLDGHVFADETFHSVFDAAGEWRIGVQLAPESVSRDWPDGAPQQVHLDLHVADPKPAHEQATRLGARLLRADDLGSDEGHQVYADPARHPFCIGWGHPSREALAAFVRERWGQAGARPDRP
ncbi:VOC family protein [Nocardioides sp. HB32]